MAQFTRANAWNNGGTFDNPDLLWYAKGVGAMQARPLSDRSSWWFFAAIHGQYVNPPQPAFPGWGFIPGPPAVPTAPLPAQSDQDQFWDQCQHQSWYFPPWHRGYLLAIEAQIRADVVQLGGPATWALPYWNYLGPDLEFNIPPAFAQPTLPDGSPNALFVAARYGPDGDGNVYVPTPAGIQQHPNDPDFVNGPVTQDCMTNDIYTGSDTATPPPGFGGPDTGFSHGGGSSGNLENNPHNLVHVYVGGDAPGGQTYGLMSDPGLASLDPIFYLHHANIDRLWAAWNANAANTNPTEVNWLSGPAAVGDREFVMPWPGAAPWVYTPQQMNSLAQLDYSYDLLEAPSPVVAQAQFAQRLRRLGATAVAESVREGEAVTPGKKVERVGANQGPLAMSGAGARTTGKRDPGVRSEVAASLSAAAETAPPDRVFLHLENVRGTRDASVLSVYINLPEGESPNAHPELLAGSVGLFGLRRASQEDGAHGGQGLSFVLDITKIVDQLHLDHAFDVDTLPVRIVPNRPVPVQADITVGRVSVYRQGQ
ncbi:MAG TPA: tyrosinase family protein [Thermoanaerobaculia bacterium]